MSLTSALVTSGEDHPGLAAVHDVMDLVAHPGRSLDVPGQAGVWVGSVHDVVADLLRVGRAGLGAVPAGAGDEVLAGGVFGPEVLVIRARQSRVGPRRPRSRVSPLRTGLVLE